jgi:hypothetical protein
VYNTANGRTVLNSNTTGSYNTACGYSALRYNTGGYGNTADGKYALATNTTGNFNTAIGDSADVSSTNLTNATAIGYNTKVNASNKVVIGNSSVSSIGGYSAWTNYSDRRMKENIIYNNDLGLNLISRLKPVSFNYIEDKYKQRRDGLIAQDVQQALKELGLQFSGLVTDSDPALTLNLSYGEFVIPLINAVQELNKQNQDLKQEVEELKALINEKLNK